ncbi:MAG: FTR1 family protein [Bacteroidia bacterium]
MLRSTVLLLVLLTNPFISKANTDPRLIIHLLDYVATDYSRAVNNGEIINEFEYAEMQEFSIQVNSLLKQVNADTTILLNLSKNLDSLIDYKASPKDVAKQSNLIKSTLIDATGISLAPTKWPSLKNGKTLYAANCMSCHGQNGDGNGPSAAGLDPSPTVFSDKAGMSEKSPLQAYHTIRFGVEGTSMVAFNQLSDEEVWDLSFYISTLRFQQTENTLDEKPDLEIIATSNDNKLISEHNFSGEKVAKARFFQPKKENESPLEYAKSMLLKAQDMAISGFGDEAIKLSLNAYLEGVEPVELSLSASNPRLVQSIELELGDLRKLYKNGRTEAISKKTETVLALIVEAENTLGQKESSWWLTFSLAASVILREGLEAFLVIIIIISVLKKANAAKGIKYVHGGWLAAVGLGVLGWFFTGQLLKMSGMQRELLEGIIALVAVAILFYIGFWMHGKSQAQKWNQYIKEKINKLLNKQSMLGLAALSFLVVFREAFESVLFLSAISLEEGGEHKGAIGLGVLVAFALVGVLAVLMLRFSKRIPITQLFKFSALIIAVLSVILVGKGVHAIQEAGYIGISAFPINLRATLLGIYPTIQSILAQIAMIAITIGVWQWQNKLKPATMAKA